MLQLFLLLRFLSGIASAFVLVFSTTLILEKLTAAGRGHLSAIHFAGVGCGIAFSAILISVLSQSGATWQMLWLSSAVATLLLLIAAFFLVPAETTNPLSEDPQQHSTTAVSAKSKAKLKRLILAYGLFGFGYVITATFVSVIARTVPELNAMEQYVWLAVGIGAAPSIYLWNQIAARISTRFAFSLACVIEAIGVALTVVSQTPLVFLFGAFILGATFMGITALGLMEARRFVSPQGPVAIRKTLALMTASFGFGQVLGPWFAGQLHAMTGSFTEASLVAAAALLFAGFLAWL